MTIHANTPLTLAHQAPMSTVTDHFESQAFGNYRKGEEGRQKLALGVLNRLDNLARGLSNLGKAFRGR